jgi:hypothetical protein
MLVQVGFGEPSQVVGAHVVPVAEIPWFSAATAGASPSTRSLNRSAENLDGHLAPKTRIAGSPHFDHSAQHKGCCRVRAHHYLQESYTRCTLLILSDPGGSRVFLSRG